MPDPQARIDARLQEIEQAIAALARRVALIEDASPNRTSSAGSEDPASISTRGMPAGSEDPASIGARAASISTPAETLDVVSLLSLVGRTCMVLGGAYLLRALTETGRLPGASGVGLGLVYSVAWFGAADRASLRRPVNGLFHGLAGILIGLPLLWEASVRFQLMAPGTSALAVGSLTAIALAVAWHRRLQSLAGVATVGAASTAVVLAIGTGALLPYTLMMIVLAVAAWWMSDACRWPWLRWPAALAADLMVAALAARASLDPPADPPAMAIGAALLLMAVTLGMVGRHAIGRERRVRPFDAMQTLLALVAGLAAAMTVARHVGPSAAGAIAAGTLVVGVAAYVTALRLLRRHREGGQSFYYYSSLGILLVLIGVSTVLSGLLRDLVFTLLALTGAWLGARAVHPIFGAHSAVLAVAAAVSAGLVACSAAIWLALPAEWPAFPLTGWIVLGAALPGGLIPRRAPTRRLEIATSVSRLLLAVVLVATLGTLIVLVAGPAVTGTPPNAGQLASLKTVVLAGAAVALALIARLPFGGELGWLAYPALLAGGIKFVLEDLRVSAPSTLFIALAAYGAALILTARIRQR